MSVELKGPSAMALTAGILLLSRSRSFGQPISVSVLGEPDDIALVRGPALVHAPVLASCGVGRELGAGALVIVPGPADAPLAVSIREDGVGDWFFVDRAGVGVHPATRAFVALCRDPDPRRRALARELRQGFAAMGCPAEPALLDLLCGTPAPPLLRLSLALRAGQAMSAGPRVPLTRFLDPNPGALPDPIEGLATMEDFARARLDGRLGSLLDRLSIRVRDRVEDWMDRFVEVDPEGEHRALLFALVELLGHVAGLPAQTLLPPLAPAADAVAVHLGPALSASRGEPDANGELRSMFRFLGGRFVTEARYPVELAFPAPPSDPLERWAWFCQATRQAADTADALWRRIIDRTS